MFKNYDQFLNENLSSGKHSLSTLRSIDIKYDSESREFLKVFVEKFGKKNEHFPSHMNLHEHNIDTNIPTLEFSEINQVFPSWKENKVDNRSAVNFILSLVDPGGEREATQHYETMESYQPQVPEEIQKFSNRWGYLAYYTFIILKTPGYDPKVHVHDNRLLVTFVKDPILVKKYLGSITGRKYGL